MGEYCEREDDDVDIGMEVVAGAGGSRGDSRRRTENRLERLFTQ